MCKHSWQIILSYPIVTINGPDEPPGIKTRKGYILRCKYCKQLSKDEGALTDK